MATTGLFGSDGMESRGRYGVMVLYNVLIGQNPLFWERLIYAAFQCVRPIFNACVLHLRLYYDGDHD
jgi:hypothetical protein